MVVSVLKRQERDTSTRVTIKESTVMNSTSQQPLCVFSRPYVENEQAPKMPRK